MRYLILDKKLLEAKLDTLNKYPNAVPQEKPIAVFIVGQPGAGKSTIINSLENKDQFILLMPINTEIYMMMLIT